MGVRLGIGIGLLVAFLVVGLFCAWSVGAVCSRVTGDLSLAAQAAAKGDMTGASRWVQRAHAHWENRRNAVATLSDHSPMDEIDSLFARALVYCRTGDAQSLWAECMRISCLVDALADAHRLTWWNIF